MTGEELRSARLLFDDALARGDLDDQALRAAPEVADAVRTLAVPSAPSRAFQRIQTKRGKLTYEHHVLAPMVAARRKLLGDAALAPPRFLVRMDEFPHVEAWDQPQRYGTATFRRFHEIMSGAGVPYLLAVLPRVPRDYGDPDQSDWRAHDDGELAMLQELRRDPDVAFGVHGLDHRTRNTNPRKHSEWSGRKPKEVAERLDAADAVLREQGLATDVFVAPFNRFDAMQWPLLARRYHVVTGGPESIGRLGFHGTTLWRGAPSTCPPTRRCTARRARSSRPSRRSPRSGRASGSRSCSTRAGRLTPAGATSRRSRALAETARPWSSFMAAIAASQQTEANA